MKNHTPLTQDELKTLVGFAAVEAILPQIHAGELIGVGTGSTVNKFIDALGPHAASIKGAVSSSEASTARMVALGIRVVAAESVQALGVYVDGADEINAHGHMIKGGGAALTREKIVAALARQFICIVDESKCVDMLGKFPLPVEVIPMAAAQISRQFAAIGGTATLRQKDGQTLVTDNGQHLLDVHGLQIADAAQFERDLNQWPGTVTNGIFAQQRAHMALVASASANNGAGGVKRIVY